MAPKPVERTKEQLLAAAEELAADVLQTTAEQAFRRLDAGEFRGTMFEAEMAALRFLLAGDELPAAAE